MDGRLRMVLLIVVIAICGALIMSDRVRRSFVSEWTPVDSFERRGIPIEIIGSKYPSIRINLLDDAIGEFRVGVGHKLYCASDTLTIRIFINNMGERIYGRIIEE